MRLGVQTLRLGAVVDGKLFCFLANHFKNSRILIAHHHHHVAELVHLRHHHEDVIVVVVTRVPARRTECIAGNDDLYNLILTLQSFP